LEPKEAIETGLSSAMSWVRPGDLNNPDMSIKGSQPKISQDRCDCMIPGGIF
jgi:hypothetical protein